MASIRPLLNTDQPLVLPGVHDALSARIAIDAGFTAISVGGAAVAATQLGLPDVGLQSFGEYRDAVGKILAASSAPVVIDGENGFGDVKAVTRTVSTFENMGVAAVAIEDLHFPPVMGQPPAVISVEEMDAKLRAALAARRGSDMMIIARTDASYAISPQEAIARARRFEAIGADAALVTGLPDLDAMRALRAAVKIPLLAIVIESGPWVSPTVQDAKACGFGMILHPAALLVSAATAYRDALRRIQSGATSLPEDSAGYGFLASALGVAEWASIDSAARALS